MKPSAIQKAIYIVILSLVTLCSYAQTQQGIVKTRGRMVNGQLVAGQKLSGATITLNFGNALVSGQNGAFSFNVPASKHYSVVSASKIGYVLVDNDLTKRVYTYSSQNPIIVVLEDEAQRQTEINKVKADVSKSLRREIRKREDEIENLLEQNKITQEKYDSLQLQIKQYRDRNEELVQQMADVFVKIDFDQLDDFNRQIQYYIANGELQRADSMIQSKGSLEERFAKVKQYESINGQREAEIAKEQLALEKSRELEQKQKADLAKDLYSKHLIYSRELKIDSALYCLKLRADIDTANSEYCYEYANMALEYHQLKEAGQYLLYCAQNHNLDYFIYYFQAFPELVKVFDAMGKHDEARKIVEMQERVIDEMEKGGGDVFKATNLLWEMDVIRYYLDQKDYDSCARHIEKIEKDVESIFKDNIESNYKNYVKAQQIIGQYYRGKGETTKCTEHYMKSINLLVRLIDDNKIDNQEDLAYYLSDIGALYYLMDDVRKSIEFTSRATLAYEELASKGGIKQHEKLASIYGFLATLYRVADEDKLSYESGKKAVEIYQALNQHNSNLYATEIADIRYGLAISSYFFDISESLKQLSMSLQEYLSLAKEHSSSFEEGVKKDFKLLRAIHKESKALPTDQLDSLISIFFHSVLTDTVFCEKQTYYALTAIRSCIDFYFDTKQYDKCIALHKEYAATPALGGENAVALIEKANIDFVAGRSFYYLKQYAESSIRFEKSVTIFDAIYQTLEYEWAKNMLLYIYNLNSYNYAYINEFEKSLASINKAIILAPSEANYYDSKGEVLLIQGKNNEALEIWKKVLELNPDFLKDYPDGTNLSNGLKKLGMIE